jgi:UDP-2,4-diacetamido-2,4,6-trideoxy-beta-L-altropyranose hydrolase
MNFVIKADGGPEIGMGHLMRCQAIAREALNSGHDVCFFVKTGVAGYVKENGFKVYCLSETYTILDEAEELVRAASDCNTDCVIIDSYIWLLPCYKRIKESFYTAVIDDFVRLPYTADIIINANLYAPGLDYSSCDADKLLLGGKYALLREEFKNTPPADFRREARRVLVTMGGADINNYTPTVLESLADIADIEVVAIAGPMTRRLDEIRSTAKLCKGNVTILNSPNNMAEIMQSCDIAVSSAGSTVYELCAMGIPSVLIKQADNQSLICDYFDEKGSMKVLGDYKTVKPEAITNAVNEYLYNFEAREKAREALLTLVDRNGAENILNAIISGMGRA